MPIHTFDEEVKKDFDKLKEKYDDIVLLVSPKENGKTAVCVECAPISFIQMLDQLLTYFLRTAKENDAYDELKELIHVVVARAEAKNELLTFFKEKKEKEINPDKLNFASEMMGLLFKSLLEDDDDDDDD